VDENWKGPGAEKEKPSLHRAFTTIRVSELPHYITATLPAVQRDERNPYRSFYYADETLGGRNGPAMIASGIITSKYFSHLTHLTD
jgi:hypothetical protein